MMSVLILKSEGNPSHGLERSFNIRGERRGLCFCGIGRADSGLMALTSSEYLSSWCDTCVLLTFTVVIYKFLKE